MDGFFASPAYDAICAILTGLFFVTLASAAVAVWRARSRRRTRLAVLEHVAVIAERGLPLGPGLVALAKESGDWTIRAIADRCQETSSLASALEAHPRTFDAPLVALLRIAEEKGALAAAAGILAVEEAARDEVRWRFADRMLYPLVLAVAVLGVSAFLEVVLIPKFRSIFESMDQPDDATWIAAVAATAMRVGTVLVFGVGATLASDRAPGRFLRRSALALASRLPVLGRPVRRWLHSQWLARASALVEGGAPLPEALADAATTVPAWRAPLERAARLASEGQPLRAVLDEALGPDAAALAAPLAISVDGRGLPVAFGEASRRFARTARRRLGTIGEAARPLPVMLLALVVGLHVLSVWRFILTTEASVIGGVFQ